MRFFCEVKKHEIEIKMEPIISFCFLYSLSESSFNSSTFIDLVESGFLHVMMFFKREGGGPVSRFYAYFKRRKIHS